MTRELPPPDLLRQLLRYEPETGKLFWLHRPKDMFQSEKRQLAWNERYAGREAFTSVTCKGYLSGSIFNKSYMAHRIIWAIAYGSPPALEVDHIDGRKTDNRLQNLRMATASQNHQNCGVRKSNTSGFKGVSWGRDRSKWQAQIKLSGKGKHLGYFDTPELAYAAYCAAAAELHGEFARTA